MTPSPRVNVLLATSKPIPINPTWGKALVVNGYRHLRGIVRHAKDPSLLYDYMRSYRAETTVMAGKNEPILTKDQIKNYQEHWQHSNNQSLGYKLYNHTAGQPPPFKFAPAQMSTAETAEIILADSELNDTTGVRNPNLGEDKKDRSGKALRLLQSKGEIANIVYADNSRRAIQYRGDILIDLIPKIYTGEQIITTLREDLETEDLVKINHKIVDVETGREVIINDFTIGKYTAASTVGPTMATRRLEASENQIAFIKAVPAVGMLTADLVARNQDWPGADEFADRIKKGFGIQDEPEEGEKPQQQQQKPEEQKAAAEVEKLKVETEGKKLDNEKTQLEIQKLKQEMGSERQQEIEGAAQGAAQATLEGILKMFQQTQGGQQ